jgi:hypothetical protein
MTMMIDMTEAKIGRLMKKRDIMEARQAAGLACGGFGASPAACGATGAPGLSLSRLSTMMRSPGLSPPVITQSLPAYSPAVTGRGSTAFLSFASMTTRP